MSKGGSGYYAALGDPRYAYREDFVQPIIPDEVADEDGQWSPARHGSILGSLFRSPTNYTRFTGGLDQLAEDGQTVHPIDCPTTPYSYVGIGPSKAWAMGFDWRPKLSAFVNKALGAANADRTPATWVEGPADVAASFAVPRLSYLDSFPPNTVPPYNRQPGYVTLWPTAVMGYRPMGAA